LAGAAEDSDDESDGAVEVTMQEKAALSDDDDERSPGGTAPESHVSGRGETVDDGLLDMFAATPTKGIDRAGPLIQSQALKNVSDMADALEVRSCRSCMAGPGGSGAGGSHLCVDHWQDNWDDHEGYYRTLVGEVMLDRYQVLGSVGKGVFSTVLRCQDRHNDDRLVVGGCHASGVREVFCA
jgi:hypothetical protein